MLMTDDLNWKVINYKAINMNLIKQIGNYIQWNSKHLSQETPNLLEHFQNYSKYEHYCQIDSRAFSHVETLNFFAYGGLTRQLN